MSTPITDFRGEWRFLSNFAHIPVVYEGVTYPTAEHAYQAAKTLLLPLREEIAALPTPGEAKKLGRKLPLRPDWEAVKIAVMLELLEAKFSAHYQRNALLRTGDRELVEGNTWGDTFWGQCPVGVGENWLGRLLMSVRETLQP